MSKDSDRFDVVIIGDGDAGNAAALCAATMGQKTAMLYRGDYAGTCLNVGCVPSKFLIHHAEIAQTVRKAGQSHITSSAPKVDLAAIVHEKQRFITQQREAQFRHDSGIEHLTIIDGEGVFESPTIVVVGKRKLRADRIIIATGTRPSIPEIEGIDTVEVLTSDTIMSLTTVPEHLIVLGGGYIGCELGQTYRRFGSKVTIIDTEDRLLSEEDNDASELLSKAFEQEGIHLALGYDTKSIEANSGGMRVTATKKHSKSIHVEGTHLLVATGRIPNTEGLNLNAAGVKCNKHGYIKVNGSLETNVAGIYAVGDINGQQPYTRVAQLEGQTAVSNAFSRKRQILRRSILAHAIFTDPPIASVGLTEQEAKDQGVKVLVSHFDMSQLTRAMLEGVSSGLVKLIADRETHRIMGAQIVDKQATELIYSVVVAMQRRSTLESLVKSPDVFPTWHEALHVAAQKMLQNA